MRTFKEGNQVMNGFVEICPVGTTEQSSHSRWSKADDPMRALSNERYDFAFHTQHEMNPWWEYTFLESQRIHAILLENRRNRLLQHVNYRIAVTLTMQDGEEIDLYRGCSQFGTLETDDALALRIDLDKPIQKVLITLLHFGCLHLKRVRFFVRDTLYEGTSNRHVYATRHDGLGERLRTIILSNVLSTNLNRRSKIVWKPINGAISGYHDVDNADQIFDKSYIDENFVTAVANDAVLLDGGKEWTDIVANNIIVNQTAPNSFPAAVRNLYTRDAFSSAFEEIQFCEDVAEAMEDAKSIEIEENSIALHLRAGDIVYGPGRYAGNFGRKVIPYQMAEKLIELVQSHGSTVYLFGQDADLINHLTRKWQLNEPQAKRQSHYSGPALAMFDIILMSRCQIILAGWSGFAALASMIGRALRIDPNHALTDAETFRSLSDPNSYTEKAVDELQKAFSIWYMLVFYNERLSQEDRTRWANEILKLDPQNPRYAIYYLQKCSPPSEEYEKIHEMLLKRMMESGVSPYELEIIREYVGSGRPEVVKGA